MEERDFLTDTVNAYHITLDSSATDEKIEYTVDNELLSKLGKSAEELVAAFKELQKNNQLPAWWTESAAKWEMAFPVGNGFSGAMIYGDVDCERINLTEEKIWSGDKMNTENPEFRDKIDELRRLLSENKPVEAEKYTKVYLKESFHQIHSQETAGDLMIKLNYPEKIKDKEVLHYQRELDLNNGVVNISYEKGMQLYTRQLFASYPDKLIAFSQRGPHSARIFFERENILDVICLNDEMTIRAKTAYGDHEFFIKIKISTDGKLIPSASEFLIENAETSILFIKISTEKVPKFTPFETGEHYHAIYSRHTSDFKALMNRSDIVLCSDDCRRRLDSLTTAERIKRLKDDSSLNDSGLVETYFQFGKYLLISSSRPGSLPPNLQGVWNTYMEAYCSADYHTNVDLQMNYWPAESANLSECTIPLFDYMNKYLLESGQRTARINYRCAGTVLHHLSDIYGFTDVAGGIWGLWPMGGAWLCYHMWEHYLYTLDKEFLRDTAYRYISECVRFFLDYMFLNDEGYLTTGPSVSPENQYFINGEGSETAELCLSPAMDIEIISGLFKFYIETENLLNINADQKKEAENALAKMPPLKIGKYGQLMEWQRDYDEPNPGHRHISHLFALYPDCAISEDTPDLLEAAGKTVDRRVANGGGFTGWSCAWLIALYARLRRPDDVFKMIRKLLTHSTKKNLFSIHPPFQIDGNLGGAAALIEMVLQSQNKKIILLPALPKQFNSGHFVRLMARGGIEVSAAWEDGNVIRAVFRAIYGDYKFKAQINGRTYDISLTKGSSYEYRSGAND